jgi:hypothetical protein
MSDQPTEVTSKKRLIRTRSAAPATSTAKVETLKAESPARPVVRSVAPDAVSSETAASAALALAVSSAKTEAARPEATVEPLKISDTPEVASPSRIAMFKRPIAQAAAVLVAIGAGWLGAQAFATTPSSTDAMNRQLAETAQALRQGQNDVVRLTGDIKALKVAIDGLKESVDRSKADLLTRQSQMMERIERSPMDATRFTKIGEQLDRVEAIAKDPGVKLAALTERFDRIERQMTTLQSAAAKPAPAMPAPVEGPAQTGSVETKPAEQKPSPRDVAVEGWVLHEVYDGVALIEGRNRRLYEVSQGGNIPGVGPVEAIERRGKRWVVLTPKGFIGSER